MHPARPHDGNGQRIHRSNESILWYEQPRRKEKDFLSHGAKFLHVVEQCHHRTGTSPTTHHPPLLRSRTPILSPIPTKLPTLTFLLRPTNHRTSKQQNSMVVPVFLEISCSSDDESSFCVADQQNAIKPEAEATVADTTQCDDRRPERSVHFCDQVQIQSISSWRQYSAKEWENTYISSEENKQKKCELRNIIKRIGTSRSSTLNKSSTFLTRDDEDSLDADEMRVLEIYESTAQLERRKRIGRNLEAVLRQQRLSGSINEHWVMDVYRDMTAASAWAAHLRGILDQQIHHEAPPPVQMMIR